jgi:hypothetical protein
VRSILEGVKLVADTMLCKGKHLKLHQQMIRVSTTSIDLEIRRRGLNMVGEAGWVKS